MPRSTVSDAELARFDALAGSWWNPSGPMRALHAMNPARVGWMCERVARAFPDQAGLNWLDVGCGAGIAAEALARRGFTVLGIDAAAATIGAAWAHADGRGLPLAYRVATVEELIVERLRFPVVAALEVIEHVPDPAAFLRGLGAILKPGGLLFISTLNRTGRSFLAAKVGAEYLLQWLPVGTHRWDKFITPAELGALLRGAGLLLTDLTGLAPGPLGGGWRTTRDPGVNYMIAARAA